MDNSLYVALSRQLTLRRELDVVANNLANMDTAGFKVEQLIVQAEPRTRPKTFQVNEPVQYTLDTRVGRDFAPGALKDTGAPLDLALDGDGFFQVRTAEGTRYTRDGRFGLDDTGRLVTAAGDAVLDDAGGEIVLNPDNGRPSISPDGVVSQFAGQGESLRVGKIGVVRFNDRAALQKTGGNLYATDVVPTPVADVKVRQGFLEGSNVQPVVEVTRLIELNRAYERAGRIVDQTADLSRRAVERLGRVG